ncbi:EamA family transporter [Luteimonas aquatica]|uniref:EamA family transporter n=1 Tax=Luteimonas aquatica TaxID=450364 RepID=UPI001F57717C|nr:EamA family transporter [Luteimonas aquatica]
MHDEGKAAATGTPATRSGLAACMAVASMTSVQLGAALAHPVMDAHGSFATTWARLVWAALLLGLIVRPNLRRYRREDLLAALALGTAIATMTLSFFVAITRVPLGLVVAIEFLGPLGVAALGFARSWRLVWLLLAFAGVLLLVRDRQGWSVDLAGFGFALLAGAGWGAYILLSKHIGKAFKGLDGLAVSFAAAALIATPFGLSDTGLRFPTDLALSTVGLAVLTPLLPYALEMMALRSLQPATFGILMSAEPGIGALAGYLLLHEPLSPQQIGGIALVICASAGAVISTRE